MTSTGLSTDSTKLQCELGWRPAHTDFAGARAYHRLPRGRRALVALGQGGRKGPLQA